MHATVVQLFIPATHASIINACCMHLIDLSLPGQSTPNWLQLCECDRRLADFKTESFGDGVKLYRPTYTLPSSPVYRH